MAQRISLGHLGKPCAQMQEPRSIPHLGKINDFTFHLARLSNPNKSDRIAHASHLELYKSNVDMTPINFPAIAWNTK